MKRFDRHKLLLLIFGILSIAVMVTIFLFSQQTGKESYNLSKTVMDQAKDRGLDVFTPQITIKNTGTGKPSFDLNVRKWAHVYLYALLGMATLLWCAELLRGKRLRLPAAAAMAFGICLLYACTDEFHQTFVDSREGKAFDLIYDALGFGTSIILVLILLLLAGLIYKIHRRKTHDPH